MSAIPTRSHLRLADLGAALLARWTERRRRRSAGRELRRLLAARDDHLLDDIGIDRAAARRLLGDADAAAAPRHERRDL